MDGPKGTMQRGTVTRCMSTRYRQRFCLIKFFSFSKKALCRGTVTRCMYTRYRNRYFY